jgi:DNA-binding response OmpR family regulator
MAGAWTASGVVVCEPAGRRPTTRVLVVDDDDEMRTLVRRTLEFEGYEVSERDRGTHVVDDLRRVPFDLIILDKEMPGVTGVDLLPILRREFPGVPVLFVTAFGGRQVADTVLRLGAARYLEKPFRLAQLREAVDGLLRPPADEPR